jgi:hypothetical protein
VEPEKIRHLLDECALHALSGGTMPNTSELPSGTKALDIWWNDHYGSVLFWVARQHDLQGYDHAVVYHHDARRVNLSARWRSIGSGARGASESDPLIRRPGSGLQKIGGMTREPLQLVFGVASRNVALIRVDHGRAHENRRPGIDGFFLIGASHHPTYAYAVGADGKEYLEAPLVL